MSLAKFFVGSALVVLLFCLDGNYCSIVNRSEENLGIIKSDNVSTIEFVARNRTYESKNETEVQIWGGHEVTFEEIKTDLAATLVEESRKTKNQNKNQKGFMERILPMMIIPFMVSTSIIPLMLISLKLMILKSAFIAKIAVLLILLNMFRRRTSGEGGVFNHNVNENDIAMQHYGYYGDEEYGAYVNRRRRKRSFP